MKLNEIPFIIVATAICVTFVYHACHDIYLIKKSQRETEEQFSRFKIEKIQKNLFLITDSKTNTDYIYASEGNIIEIKP